MKIGLMAIECILKFSSQRDEKKTEDKITPHSGLATSFGEGSDQG